jgi:hypothetical protein
MNRTLASLFSAVAFVAAVQAQCFESNFGTLLGTGDDSAFPSTTTANPMNITFPMGGTFASYTHVTVNTNGCAFLWNAATGVLGATATGYSTSVTTQLTNLRGAVGGSPRIAPFWRDLNLAPANNGGLWLNNTIPGKCVITWANAVQFGTTTPVFTVQAQLLDTGEIKFFYNGTVANSAAMIAGISQGGAIAAVPGVDLSVGGNVSATRLMFQQFASGAIDLQTTGLSFVPSGGGYSQSAAPCVPASNNTYGAGCYNIPGTGNYEFYADAAVASAALQGNAIQYVPNGSGYTATYLTGGATAYVAPTGAATNVFATASDDGTAIVTLGAPLSTPQGPVGQITVSANGIVTLNNVGNNNGEFNLIGSEFAAAPGVAFYAWHDYNETEAGSGRIKLEQVGSVVYLTWDNVENYSTPLGVNPGTMQFQLDLTTGVVTTVWVTVDTNITSTFGSTHLVGWKAGGAVTDNGSIVLATALPLTTVSPTLSLALGVTGLPLSTPSSGSTVTYNLSNIPLACPAPATVFHFGGLMLSLGQDLPGTDVLTGYGIDAPGCNLHITSLDVLIPYIGNTPTNSVPFDVPAGVPAGAQFYAQAFSLVCPNTLPNGQNNAGITLSNGVRSLVSSF